MITDELIQAYAPMFVSRRDDYARQRDNGRYVRVGSALTLDALRLHLQGRHTLGTYVIDEQGYCCFAVFDSDSADGLAVLARLQSRLALAGVPSYLEQSRRGGHLWVLFSMRVSASVVRSWLLPYCPAGVEFYPKQEQGNGYGSLIRLPFGVHKLTGERYPFVSWSAGTGAVPLASSVETMIAWLATCERASLPDEPVPTSGCDVAMNTHTSKTKRASTSNPVAPARSSSITEWCAMQDPFVLMSRYVKLDRRGMACCPFGEHHRHGQDRHPSFRVYSPSTPGGNSWHCYTWGKGGNVFNFLSMYHGVDARSLWSRILAGESFS